MTDQTMEIDLSSGSSEQIRERLRDWLNVDTPISDAALIAVMNHRGYATKLGAMRHHANAVTHLLDHPPAVPAHLSPSAPAHSSRELMTKAGGSLVRWMRDGARQVDSETRERRWQACMSCPQLADPPQNLAYAAAGLISAEKKICRLCGCNVRAKGRFPHETCPSEDADRPGYSRWGEFLDVDTHESGV